jgi:LysM repeat protein
LICSSSAIAAAPAVAEGFIVGSVFDYSTKPGDSLVSIGARFGVASEVLAHQNALKLNVKLLSGQMLTIDHRHIAPMPQSAWFANQFATTDVVFFSRCRQCSAS